MTSFVTDRKLIFPINSRISHSNLIKFFPKKNITTELVDCKGCPAFFDLITMLYNLKYGETYYLVGGGNGDYCEHCHRYTNYFNPG